MQGLENEFEIYAENNIEMILPLENHQLKNERLNIVKATAELTKQKIIEARDWKISLRIDTTLKFINNKPQLLLQK
jgi:hypothetical protein